MRISFAVWGIEDMIRDFGRDRAVARVGGEPIELEEAQLAVRREIQRIARQLGPSFEADEAVRRAVAGQALAPSRSRTAWCRRSRARPRSASAP